MNCIDHTPVLLRNVDSDQNHWVGIQLIGGPGSPRDGVGSTVYLTAGGIRHREDVMSGGSYESSNDQRLHFGLGQVTSVDSVEIHWASTGTVEKVSLPSVDRYFVIEESKGIIPSVYDGVAKQASPAK
ncbi:MAG: ASPIC/UnbV domain-containing protein [Terracidiphilus sp.]